MELSVIADAFRFFAKEANLLEGHLYEHLSLRVAEDTELLEIAANAHRPPVPNLFYYSIHYILKNDPAAPVSKYYGSIVESPAPPTEAYPHFRSYVLEQREEIVRLLKTRLVQTNQVARCSFLLPAFCTVHRLAGMPLSLVDVGCSAGLHLLWDRYLYDYGEVQVGSPEGRVNITAELRGDIAPPISDGFPPCQSRVGIDLNPVDLSVSDERAWFEALIWPDHPVQRKLADAATQEVVEHPPPMLQGDALKALPGVVESVPDDTALCIYHCHALNQFSRSEKDAFQSLLEQLSQHRTIYWLSGEGYDVHLRTLQDGTGEEFHLAQKDGHGRWVEWLDS